MYADGEVYTLDKVGNRKAAIESVNGLYQIKE